MSVVVVRQGPAVEHRCELPGYWERRRLGVNIIGSLVQCAECGVTWRWSWGYDEKRWESV